MKYIKLFDNYHYSQHNGEYIIMRKKYKVYRGYDKNSWVIKRGYNPVVLFYTDSLDVAKTYGRDIEEKEIQLQNAFVWDVGYLEFNETNIVQILENLYREVIKTGEDKSFNWYGDETYTISKSCDGIVIKNIVDPESGGLDWSDEEYENDMDGFQKTLEEEACTVYILPFENPA